MTFIGSYKILINNEEFIYSIADSQVLLSDGLFKKISFKGKQKIKYVKNRNIVILNAGTVRKFESILNLNVDNLDDLIKKFIDINTTIKDKEKWKILISGINKNNKLDLYYIGNINKDLECEKISNLFAGSGFKYAEKRIKSEFENTQSIKKYDNFIDPLILGYKLLKLASNDSSTNNKLQFSIASKLGFSVIHEPNIEIENFFYDTINFNLTNNKFKTSKSFLDNFYNIFISHLDLYILNETNISLKEDLNNLIKYFILKQPKLFFDEYTNFNKKYLGN